MIEVPTELTSCNYSSCRRYGGLLAIFLMTSIASASLRERIANLESQYKMQIGVFAEQGDKSFSFRADERFAYCSVFKWILCADILKMSDEAILNLNKKISYSKADILKNSPETLKHLADGQMSVLELCAATVAKSDNAAAVLLSTLVGGTSGLQNFVRSLGDTMTRFDRPEPDLNSNEPGGERDTTTPAVMTNLLKTLLAGPTLKEASKKMLHNWLQTSTTGANRIRAGVPRGWPVGGKTGTGEHGAANDVAVIFPPNSQPIYLSIFTTGDGASLSLHEKGIAEATKLILAEGF